MGNFKAGILYGKIQTILLYVERDEYFNRELVRDMIRDALNSATLHDDEDDIMDEVF